VKQLGFAAIAFAVTTGLAWAGEERACASQYALEDHLLLEWAALGGDPHAQMAIAQCAYPAAADIDAMTPAERRYAVRWTTIAVCEAAPTAAHDRRDIRLRRLKENANISFRRFGGLSKDEKLNWREKDFMEYRKEQTALLAERHERLLGAVGAGDLAAARQDLADQLARMGPTGLLKLAELTSCTAFGASKEFEAAAWSAAAEAWRGSEIAGVYAAADSEDYDLPKIAMEKSKKLSGADRRVAMIEKERLLRSAPDRIAALESKIAELEERDALDRLSDFTLPARRADAGAADAATPEPPALTTALQFALETLGYVRFINGPDNDYGPTTREAVLRMQAREDLSVDGDLTNAEIRGAVCRAALKDDPVSLYHVAVMYWNGWGFPRDAGRAAAAIARAETAMIAALGDGGLPSWKQDAYQAYAARIRSAARDIRQSGLAEGQAICR
jgi:peptidoglycan hydrolase-like protein with peptidoglycan-binding domain